MSNEEKKEDPKMDEKNIEFEEKIDAAMSDFFKNSTAPFPGSSQNSSDSSSEEKEETVSSDMKELELLEDETDSEELDEIVHELAEEENEQILPESEETGAKEAFPIDEQIPETAVTPENVQKTTVPKRKSARPTQIKYVHMDDSEFEAPVFKEKKKHKALKVTSIIAAMLLVSAGCVYAGMGYYYSDKFFEGTTINGINCSGMTAYEVEQMIATELSDYAIEVKARNQEPQIIDGEKINYRYTPTGEVLELLKSQKPYEWVRGYYETTEYTVEEHTAFDKAMLETEVRALECAKKENQIKPEDAYVAFNNTEFIIVPETEGSELNVRNAYKLLNDAITVSAESVDLESQEGIYETAKIKSDNSELQATMNAYNNFAKASITYTFGEKTVTLDGETIKTWLQFDEKGQLVVNDASFQQHIAEYVAQLAAENDTVGTSREFYTTNGRVVYVYGSAYGWKIDQAAEVAQLKQEIESGTQTTREPVYSMRANAHGYNDFGSTYIEVDLSDQHMYYYQNGEVIFESDIVSGNMSYEDRMTPPGIFTLYYKKSPDVLRGAMKEDGKYEYEAKVQYWMPFNGGIGFHDADWQPYFGGDRYLEGGSHGCINLPPDNAAILYSIIEYGVPIICFY